MEEFALKNTHKATAIVGKDTIENAEYFVFENITFEKEKTFKGKVEDFCSTLAVPFWRMKNISKDTYWKIRYGFQRMFKGYDNMDIIELYSSFISKYTKVLNEYKKNRCGHPWELSNEEWNDILDKMIYHLHYMDEDNVENELKKDMPEEWIPSYKTVNEIMNKHKDEFFKLFSEYFYNLWD